MPGNGLHRFYISIVLPSILAIGLFILSIFLIIIPSFERNIMDEKKVMISELINTAWSLLDEYNQEYMNNNFSLEEAQKLAASRIERIRYGDERKDYFWIIDGHPNMIMHPYRIELINTDLSNYKDPNGKKLFVEATRVVNQEEEGFIDYMWQWKDDSTRIVPKLSYVKGFEPWGWIVGTGIYLEDVKEEIAILKARLLRISFFITLLITIILSFVIRQSLVIENKRKDAEEKLMLSRQKYKSLVEASTEGTLMVLNEKIIFSNNKFNKLIGYESSSVLSLDLNDIFETEWKKIVASISDPKKSISFETRINCFDNVRKDVILSVSRISYAEDSGYIIITKEVTGKKQIEKETEYLTRELQTSLQLMNQPIRSLISGVIKCSVDATIRDAVAQMTRKKKSVLFIHKDNQIMGVIDNSDLKNRVLGQDLDQNRSVLEIMTSPVVAISENALLYEAILLFRNKAVSHLGTINDEGDIDGVLSYTDIIGLQQNSVSFLIREIEIAEEVDDHVKIHDRVHVLVNALLESSNKTQNITRIITSVSDAIVNRLIVLAMEELGDPPCEFAFMVMGSEGRMEQTLSTDQDNAIVIENVGPGEFEAAREYFLKLGKEVCNNLNLVGYRFCKGEIMAQNPKWTQPLDIWKGYFSDWINSGDPQSILDASIFFDFRCVFGNKELIKELRTHVNEAVDSKSVFFYHLAQSVVKFKPPVSIFGNIVSKDQTGDQFNVDVKKILFPIAGFIRLYALRNKIKDTNTLSRVKKLFNQKVLTKEMYDELILSYNYLMLLRFRFQTRSIMQNQPADNNIDINKLTRLEVSTMKEIFSEISNLQTKLNFDFKGTM